MLREEYFIASVTTAYAKAVLSDGLTNLQAEIDIGAKLGISHAVEEAQSLKNYTSITEEQKNWLGLVALTNAFLVKKGLLPKGPLPDFFADHGRAIRHGRKRARIEDRIRFHWAKSCENINRHMLERANLEH